MIIKKLRILIDILPAMGHFHATLKIAKLMKKNNWEVTYGCSLEFKKEIQAKGLDCEVIPNIHIIRINFSKPSEGISHVRNFFSEKNG